MAKNSMTEDQPAVKKVALENKTGARGLEDLPVHVAELVYSNFSSVERMRARRHNKEVCKIVDNMKASYQWLGIRARNDDFILLFDRNEVNYRRSAKGCKVKLEGKEAHVFDGGDYVEMAIKDLESVLKNPKCEIMKLDIEFDQDLDADIAQRIITAMHVIYEEQKAAGFNVKSLYLSVRNMDEYFSIIKMMRIGQLEAIKTDIAYVEDPVTITSITNLPQWKSIKKAYIIGDDIVFDSFDGLAQLAELTTEFGITDGDIIDLVHVCMNNPAFEIFTMIEPHVTGSWIGNLMKGPVNFNIPRQISGMRDYIRCMLSLEKCIFKKENIQDDFEVSYE